MSKRTYRPGETITAAPVGQTRRQTIEITHTAEQDGTLFVYGLLVSKKWPGDYRGTALVLVPIAEVAR